jgi:hypothetical protein
MADVKEEMVDKFLAHDIDLLRFSAGERREALKVLKQVERDLLKAIDRLDETASQTVRMRRLERMTVLVNKIIRTGYTKLKGVNRNALKGVAVLEQAKVREFVGAAVGVDLATLSVPSTLLQAATSSAVVGAPAVDWWGRQAAGLRNKFLDEMRLGIIAGENLGTLKRRIRGTRERNFKDGLLREKQKGQAEALIRTSVQSAANASREAVIKQNSDVFRGVQALTTLDERTSDICIARSGGAWNLDTGDPLPDSPVQEPYPGPPPWHFNCRTTLIGVLKDIEGIKEQKGAQAKKRLRQLSRGTQQSIDGSVAGDLNFSQWLERQSEARQRRILGPGRLELWKSGDINLTQLIDQRGRPLTLNELRQR